MSAFDVATWMILIALVVGVVLMLGRTHRRADALGWRPQADQGTDSDRRRLREELGQAGALAGIRRLASRIGADTSAASTVDRARAELLDHPAADDKRTGDPDRPLAA